MATIMIPAVETFYESFGFVPKDQVMKLSAIKQRNQLTKQTCMAYHRAASLLLAIGFFGRD